jgi:hypothetical protein
MWWWPHLAQPATCPPSVGPAGLDRRHHLQLGQADMPGIGLPPRRPTGAEDVSELQRGTGHTAPPSAGSVALQNPILQRLHLLEGADGAPDCLGGDMGVTRRGAELGVPEQHLDHPDVGVGLQKMDGEAVPQAVQRGWLRDTRVFPRRLHPAGRDRPDRVLEQEGSLWPAVPRLGRDGDGHRGRSQAPRRAMCLADVNARFSCRGDSGEIFGLLGNSQPSGRDSRQYWRSTSRRPGDSMACRSFEPLP